MQKKFLNKESELIKQSQEVATTVCELKSKTATILSANSDNL